MHAGTERRPAVSATAHLHDPQTLYRHWENEQWNPWAIDLARDKDQWRHALSAEDKTLIYWALSSLQQTGVGVEAAPVGERGQSLDGDDRLLRRPPDHERQLAVAEHPQAARSADADRLLDRGVETLDVNLESGGPPRGYSHVIHQQADALTHRPDGTTGLVTCSRK